MEVAASSKHGRARRRYLRLAGAAGALTIAVAAAMAIGWPAGRDAAEARAALEAGRLDEAARAVDAWLRSSPRSAEAHHLKARIAWARHDPDGVYRELEAARALGYPTEAMGRLWGLLLDRTGRSGQAEPHLRRAYEAGRGPDPEVAEALARIYLGGFRLTEAGAVVDRWARESPGDARPYLYRADIDRRTVRDPLVAIGDYREALRRDPTLDRARLGLADLLRTSHRNAEAAEEYDRYIDRRPDDALGYLGAGQNALELGDEPAAIRRLDRALAMAPRNPVALSARATVEVRAGRFRAAKEYSDRAVRADPFDQANRYQRMLILTRLGDADGAEAERRALDRIREDQAEFDRVSRALVQSPLDVGLRARAARWLMSHGHEDEAIEWANLVLAAEPTHPEMNRLLADHYRKRGQIGLANRHEAVAAPPADRAPSRP